MLEPIKIEWPVTKPLKYTCKILVQWPGTPDWEYRMLLNKQSELSPECFTAWLDGCNFNKYAVDVTNFPPPYGVPRYHIHHPKHIRKLENGDTILGKYKGEQSADDKTQVRQNVVYIPKEAEVHLSSRVGDPPFHGWCVLKQVKFGNGETSESYHTRLKGDLSKLTIDNIRFY